MENTRLILTTLNFRLANAEMVILSQEVDDLPASPAECLRAHDNLLGAWSVGLAARRLFSDAERAKFNNLHDRVTAAARALRRIR